MHWLSQLIASMTILYLGLKLGIVLDSSQTYLCVACPPTLSSPTLFPTSFPSRPTLSPPSSRSHRRRQYSAPAQHTTGAGCRRRYCCYRATGGPEPAPLLALRYPTRHRSGCDGRAGAGRVPLLA
jgi:hypothetical protein